MEISNIILSNDIDFNKNLYDLVHQIIKKMDTNYLNEIHFHIKEYGNNFLKKLKQLIKLINLIKEQMIKSNHENIFLENKKIILYKIFLKKSSSSYLRFEHCQELFELIN